MKHKILQKLIFLFALVLILTSCTAGQDQFVEQAAGFWMGLWHGFISFFAFIASLFIDGIEIYEKNNNGNWYNFGFILGIMMFYGGGCKGTCRRR